MIIWMNKLPRLNSGAKPLNRIGVLKAKNYPVHRSFDHIAFSLFTGNVHVTLADQDGKAVIERPSCVLALPGDVRKLRPLRPVEEFYFVYGSEYLPALFPEEETERRPQHFKMMPLEDCPTVAEYAEIMKHLLAFPLTPSRCTQLDLLAESILAESFLNAEEEPAPPSVRIVGEIENYIFRHYHDAIDWEEVARKHGISYSGLRKLWSKAHSVSPHAYVMKLRNREARELLRDRSLPVSRIAELTGYGDPRYFSRFFARINGMTPQEYRRSHSPESEQ